MGCCCATNRTLEKTLQDKIKALRLTEVNFFQIKSALESIEFFGYDYEEDENSANMINNFISEKVSKNLANSKKQIIKEKYLTNMTFMVQTVSPKLTFGDSHFILSFEKELIQIILEKSHYHKNLLLLSYFPFVDFHSSEGEAKIEKITEFTKLVLNDIYLEKKVKINMDYEFLKISFDELKEFLIKFTHIFISNVYSGYSSASSNDPIITKEITQKQFEIYNHFNIDTFVSDIIDVYLKTQYLNNNQNLNEASKLDIIRNTSTNYDKNNFSEYEKKTAFETNMITTRDETDDFNEKLITKIKIKDKKTMEIENFLSDAKSENIQREKSKNKNSKNMNRNKKAKSVSLFQSSNNFKKEMSYSDLKAFFNHYFYFNKADEFLNELVLYFEQKLGIVF